MTYNYKLDNFLVKPLNGDKRLLIYDKNGNYVDSIVLDISHFFVRNNCLVIKITNKNDIILSFVDISTAKQALSKLDSYRTYLLETTGELNRDSRPTINTLNRYMVPNETSNSSMPTVTGTTFTIVLSGNSYGMNRWYVSGTTTGTELSGYTSGVTYWDIRQATTTPVLQTPKSLIKILVNHDNFVTAGRPSEFGPDPNGVGCYFTSAADGGDPTKARVNDGDVQLGDLLYWIGISGYAEYQLETTDILDYEYLI